MRHLAHVALVFLLTGAMLASGCGSTPSELTGSVRHQNKDVVAGTVTAYDTEKNAYQGSIEHGRYTISGIPPGTVQIVVISPNPAGMASPPQADGTKRTGGREPRPKTGDEPPVVGWFALPNKYEDLATSPLKTEVKAGPNTFDIVLD